ncbi:hypothetical protein GGF43_005158, partial [Coemansia sp. RSA 2618]
MPNTPHHAAEAGSEVAAATHTVLQRSPAEDGTTRRMASPAGSPFDHFSDEDEVIGSGSVAFGVPSGNADASSSNVHMTTNGFGAKDSSPHSSSLLSAPVSPLLEASSLIPPSLQSSTISNALASSDDTPAIDDSRPLSSSDDYAAVAREAHMHWIARRKQPVSVLEQ